MLETKTSMAILGIYKEERAVWRDPVHAFPPFNKWKKQYLIDIANDEREAEEALKTEIIVDPEVVVAVQSAPKKESKMDAAHRIYQEIINENNGEIPKRKVVMQVFQDELSMSSGYASTAHNTVKQRFIK